MINKQLRIFIKITYYIKNLVDNEVMVGLFDYYNGSRGLILLPRKEYVKFNKYASTKWLLDINIYDGYFININIDWLNIHYNFLTKLVEVMK